MFYQGERNKRIWESWSFIWTVFSSIFYPDWFPFGLNAAALRTAKLLLCFQTTEKFFGRYEWKCLPSKREIAFSTAYWLTKLIFKEICIWTYITEYKNKASKQYSLRKLRDGFFSMSFWDLDVNRCLKWKCVSRLNDEASDRPKSK